MGCKSGRLQVPLMGAQLITGGTTDWSYLSASNPCILLPWTLVADVADQMPTSNIGYAAINAQPTGAYYQNPDKFYISRAQVQTVVSNPQNYPINIEATTWVCRDHLAGDALMASAAQIFTDGFAACGGSVLSTQPGVTLFQCPQWCRLFKCVKKQFSFLRPGEQQAYSLARMRPLLVDMQRWFTKSSATGAVSTTPIYYGYRGITKIIMFRIWGGVANDSTTKTLVSISAPSIDFATTYKVTCHPVVGSVATNVVTTEGSNNFGTGLTLQTVGTEVDALITNASY